MPKPMRCQRSGLRDGPAKRGSPAYDGLDDPPLGALLRFLLRIRNEPHRLHRAHAADLILVGLVAGVVAIGWGTWVYQQTQPQSLVTRSAVRNYKAAVATRDPAAAPAPHHPSQGALAWKDLTEAQRGIL